MDFYKNFDDCLVEVIDSIKRLLFSRHEDIFDRLDFDNDAIYLEPLLYTYVSQEDNKWLDCIVYGYEKNKKAIINVFSNSEGVIYLPQVGYLKTNEPNRTIVLETKNNMPQLQLNGKLIDHEFEPVLLLVEGIELVKYQHPLLAKAFTDQGTKESDIVIEDVYKTHVDHFNKGLKITQKCNPDHFNLLKKNIKKVMLFSSEKQNSFAVISAHNMIFLNVKIGDTEIYFAEHICHEGAHVTFNTLTYETKYTLFKVPFNSNFGEITDFSGDHSTIYLRFHGLFTYFEETKFLEIYMNTKNISHKNAHEAKGRFALNLMRFKISIDMFNSAKNLLNKDGMKWLQLFQEHYFRIEKAYGYMSDNYKLDEQPYDFDINIFKKYNPL
jgi:hypothetical protein